MSVLKAYYDHGNDIDSTQYDIVTLAGYSAREKHWAHFEQTWKSVVAKAWAECDMPEGLEPYLHTTDLLTANEPFSTDRGWTKVKSQALLLECSALLVEACATNNLRGVSCSILLKDYRVVKREGIPLASVEDICSSFCVASSVAWSAEFAEDFMREGAELYFDQNGPFYGSIANRKRHGKLRHSEAWNNILQVGQVDSKRFPAVQMADLLAWSIDAYQVGDVRGRWQVVMVSIPREKLHVGQHSLRSPVVDQLDALLRLKLPPRRFKTWLNLSKAPKRTSDSTNLCKLC